MEVPNLDGITYHSKDTASKVTAEALVGKSLAPFGLPDIKVVGLLPTNLPAIEADELRMDNLFLLEDDSVAIIDYESKFVKENFVKYMSYAVRVLKRYAEQNQLEDLKKLKVLVIYTADVEWAQEVYDLGSLILQVEASYLVHQDSDRIYEDLNQKIHAGENLTEEELAQLMILPLTVKGKKEKQRYIEQAVNLAKQIPDHDQVIRVVSGILTFTDKVIDEKYAQKVREELMMTKVERLIFNDGYGSGYDSGYGSGYDSGYGSGYGSGLEKGVKGLIEMGQEVQLPRDIVVQKVKDTYALSPEDAEMYFGRYWK